MLHKIINIFLIILCLCIAGCGAQLRTAVPAQLTSAVEVANFQGIRFWGDAKIPNLKKGYAIQRKQMSLARPRIFSGRNIRRVDILALSGGGPDGAFGAGFLHGWTKTGKRPNFEIVTGVSTGALIAPFAFLGSKYDNLLKEIYTKYSTKDLLETKVVAGLLGGGNSLASSEPMFKLISKYIDRKFLATIAREHSRGRRLFIGTTNLDAERPVIWDMGEIAGRGTPQALDLFRRIMLASASIPGVFPPVYIKVKSDNKLYEEMHVDGGVTNNTFLLPSQFDRSLIEDGGTSNTKVRLFIIVNNKINAQSKKVGGSVYSIAGRSISSLIRQQTKGDLLRLYLNAKKNKFDFNVASVPPRFNAKSEEAFDKSYMNTLYEVGLKAAAKGYKWQKKPNGI